MQSSQYSSCAMWRLANAAPEAADVVSCCTEQILGPVECTAQGSNRLHVGAACRLQDLRTLRVAGFAINREKDGRYTMSQALKG